MKNRNFLDMFDKSKPIIGMLHLKGISQSDTLDRFKKELDIYINNGLDAVIVEDYFGTYKDMVRCLDYMKSQNISIPFGINCLNIDEMGFELAKNYSANFVQFDSVIGHVKPRDEDTLDAFFEKWHKKYEGYILGGVRFKYQPVLSNNSVAKDLELSKNRCDAVCVTGEATGEETSLTKIKKFRNDLGNFPLIVGAGVTPDSMEDEFKYADGAIVGSYFKVNHNAENEVSVNNVKEIVAKVNSIRGKLK